MVQALAQNLEHRKEGYWYEAEGFVEESSPTRPNTAYQHFQVQFLRLTCFHILSYIVFYFNS